MISIKINDYWRLEVNYYTYWVYDGILVYCIQWSHNLTQTTATAFKCLVVTRAGPVATAGRSRSNNYT